MTDLNALWQNILSSNVLNFLLVVTFLVWVEKKTKIFSVIIEKQKTIAQQIKKAEEEKLKSELDLDATKKKHRKADGEVKKISQEANKVAAGLSEQIKEETGIQSKELAQKADKAISLEKQTASNEITHVVSQAAFQLAEEHIKQAINDRMHHKYIDEFIDDLANLKV